MAHTELYIKMKGRDDFILVNRFENSKGSAPFIRGILFDKYVDAILEEDENLDDYSALNEDSLVRFHLSGDHCLDPWDENVLYTTYPYAMISADQGYLLAKSLDRVQEDHSDIEGHPCTLADQARTIREVLSSFQGIEAFSWLQNSSEAFWGSAKIENETNQIIFPPMRGHWMGCHYRLKDWYFRGGL